MLLFLQLGVFSCRVMDIHKINPNIAKAIFLAKKQLPEFVYDAVNLEGIHYTLPEVQTLLDGVTVGGHQHSDEKVTLNQVAAWKFLFASLQSGSFVLSKVYVCTLHAIAADSEALAWGQFRSGGVTIAGTQYLPPAAASLDDCWIKLLQAQSAITDIYDRAIYFFLQMARSQFFYDVNKRMGRFMMNGILLQAGYPAINLPASRKEEFNNLMLDFYDSNEVAPMTEFMKSCLDKRIIAIMSEDH
jgi:Fic family protein